MRNSKRRMSADTYNMLWTTIILAMVALISIAGFLISDAINDDADELGQTGDVNAADGGSVTHRLTGIHTGPLTLCAENAEWRREEVEAVGEQAIPIRTFADKEVPYFPANTTVKLQPEALLALHTMAEDMPYTSGIKLCVEEGYRSWEEAGQSAGCDPYHTGYALRVSIHVAGEGSLSFSAATAHSTAAAPAAWVSANLTSYGFASMKGDGCFRYVGLPHAAIMKERGDDLSSYLTWVRTVSMEKPYTWKSKTATYRLFYLPASYGVATLTVSDKAQVLAAGDGVAGFVVALKLHH